MWWEASKDLSPTVSLSAFHLMGSLSAIFFRTALLVVAWSFWSSSVTMTLVSGANFPAVAGMSRIRELTLVVLMSIALGLVRMASTRARSQCFSRPVSWTQNMRL